MARRPARRKDVATLERLDMPLEYLDSAAYGRFIQDTANYEEARVKRLGLGL